MRVLRLAVTTAVAAATLLVASPAHARHYCGLEDPVLNALCESHVEDTKLWQKIWCLISPSC